MRALYICECCKDKLFDELNYCKKVSEWREFICESCDRLHVESMYKVVTNMVSITVQFNGKTETYTSATDIIKARHKHGNVIDFDYIYQFETDKQYELFKRIDTFGELYDLFVYMGEHTYINYEAVFCLMNDCLFSVKQMIEVMNNHTLNGPYDECSSFAVELLKELGDLPDYLENYFDAEKYYNEQLDYNYTMLETNCGFFFTSYK